MKQIPAFITALFITTVSFTQAQVASLQCNFKNVNSGSVRVILPVDHTVFYGAAKQMPVSKEGKLFVSLNGTQTGFVMVYGFNKTVRVFIQKGDRLVVDIDTAASAIAQFKGNNAEGQALLSAKKFATSGYGVENVFDKTTLEFLPAQIADEKKKTTEPFRDLFAQKKINKGFLDFAIQHYDYVYATLAVQKLGDRFYQVTYPVTHPSYKPDFPESYRKYWEETLNQYPVKRQDGYRVSSFEYYVDAYMRSYNDFKKWEQKIVTAPVTDEIFKRSVISRIRSTFKGSPLAEQAEARRLHSMFIQEKFEKVLPELVTELSKAYPKSPYLALLKPDNDKVLAFYQTASKEFASDQKVMNEYLSINSFAQLTEKFKGRMFFVDMWATWCGPCKAEFADKDGLTKFLSDKKIDMVYLSLDTDDKDQEWKSMIKYFKLSGYNVRTNDALRLNLSKVFWKLDVVGYSIPRYVLVDANGKIVEDDALRPSDKEKLYKQIMSHL